MTAIEVRDLVKRYRGASVNAVDGISFDVADGEFCCLLGPNGAGKTTTVAILTTVLAPTSGRIVIAGTELVSGGKVAARQGPARRELGVVFQESSLDLNLTAEENMRVHAVLYGLYPWRPLYRLMQAGYRRQVDDLAGLLGLGDALHRPVRALSGGTRRKLEIVRALMHRPRVLFLDEPSAGLDPESRRSLWAYLRQARSRYDTTVVLTTHYLGEAETADAVCVMAHGRIIEHGSPAEVKSRHASPALIVDAADRAALRRELAGLGLRQVTDADGRGLRVALGGRNAHSVLRAIELDLTHVRTVEPTLEEAYLMLLDHPER